MSDINLDKAALVSLVIETFNIGTFTVLFGGCLRFIFTKRTYDSGLLTPTLCLIWVLSITHWAINIARAKIAFIDKPGEAIPYLANPADPLETAKTGVYVTITVLADFFMVYRCWMVWNRNWFIIILPVLSWIATAVSGYGGTHMLLETSNGGVFAEQLVGWITSFFSTSLATNLLCTVLIAYRVLRSQLRLRKVSSQKSRVLPALIIFVESAALYSMALLALLITYELNLNTQFIIIDVTSSLIGITFSSIILRLALTNQHKPGTRSGGSQPSGSLPHSRIAANISTPNNNAYPLGAVHVSRLVETDQGHDGHKDEWMKGSFEAGKSRGV